MDAFPKDELRQQLAELAGKGIYVGTSSWKYEGWLGLIYSHERYMRYFNVGPPKLLKGRFQKECLEEYARTFKTVCLDAGLYQFPTPKILEGYFSQVGDDFRLSLKVTDEITVRRWPTMDRYGRRAGKMNEHFLDADLFQTSFLAALTPYQDRVGTIIFEFSHFHPGDWDRGREFVKALDAFFARLPKGWNYSVEVRNPSLLQAEYFEVLRRHGVAHTFNNWSRMPSVAEQMELPHSFTADFATARFLLKPGRTYEQAVEKFTPYQEIKEPNAEARMALIDLLTTPAKPGRPGRRFLYVNNRLEGCALWTIYAAITGLLASQKKVSEEISGLS
jgi:uncharacterized protein YecE (DUF72 family)